MFSNIEVRFSNNRGKVLIKCLSSNILAACSKSFSDLLIKVIDVQINVGDFLTSKVKVLINTTMLSKSRTRFKNKKTGYGTILFTIISPGGIYIEQDEVLVTNGCSRSRSRCMW